LLGNEDFDIAFYASFTPTVSISTVMTRAIGGESGAIPDSSRFAVITLFDGANAAFVFRAFEPVDSADRSKGLAPAPLPASPGIYPSFGHDGDRVASWTNKLRERSHVVIAVVDSGINPYHVAHRRPEYAVHPSRYIEGFPADTPALGLGFSAADSDAARGADDAPVWSASPETKAAAAVLRCIQPPRCGIAHPRAFSGSDPGAVRARLPRRSEEGPQIAPSDPDLARRLPRRRSSGSGVDSRSDR
jgi:hypothetical protein